MRGLLADMQEESLNELMEICRADPKQILPLIRMAKQDLAHEEPEDEQPSGEKPFHNSYTKLQRCPKEFLRSYLPDLSGGQLTDKHLRHLERNDDGSTRSIFYYACNVMGGTKWPSFCLDRDVFRRAFRIAHDKNEKPLTKIRFIDADDDDKIKVDWSRWGHFVLLPEGADQAKKELVHTLTKEKVDISDLGVCGECAVAYNWDALKAVVKWRRQTQVLYELFPKDFQKKLKAQVRREDLPSIAATAKAELAASDAASSNDKKTPVSKRPQPDSSDDESAAPPPAAAKRRRVYAKSIG